MFKFEYLMNLAVSYRNAAGDQPTDIDRMRGAMYMGYISGVMDSFDGKLFCVPNGVQISTLSDQTLNYIEKNLSIINKNAGDIVILALQKNYPCK